MEIKRNETLKYCTMPENTDVNQKFMILNEGNSHNLISTIGRISDGIDALCRVCANFSNHLVPIFEGEGAQLGLVSKIHKHLPIRVNENDTLPIYLCYHCAVTIIAFHDIVEGCIEAEHKLLQIQEDKIKRIPEEGVAVVPGERCENIGDSQELAIEIQEEQVSGEAFNEINAENLQETPAVRAEPERSSVVTDLNLPRVKKISRLPCIPSIQGASEFNQCSITETELFKVTSKNVPSPPNKSPVEDSMKNSPSMRESRTIPEDPKSKEKEKRAKLKCQPKEGSCQSASGRKLLTCHVCGKQFGQTGSLYYHLKHVHGGVKDHACDICGRCFAMKTAMQDHRRIHTGERPYVCHACGKTFKTKAALYIHSKIHLDHFPYKCSYCSKLFKFKQQKLGHETTHTRIKNHTCDTCGKSFGVKWDLTRHLRIHSKEKPFICDQCGMSFGQKRYLTNHKRIKHKTE